MPKELKGQIGTLALAALFFVVGLEQSWGEKVWIISSTYYKEAEDSSVGLTVIVRRTI